MARTSKAAALAKEAQAIDLHACGKSYDAIAADLGYANRGSAWKAVNRGLRAKRDERAASYLRIAIERYETLLAAWWEPATTGGDVQAANIVLRILEQLAKILRLEKERNVEINDTIVISADPEQYVRDLQALDV